MKLKLAIVAARKSQRQIAAEVRLTENRFSEIVCGWIEPSADSPALSFPAFAFARSISCGIVCTLRPGCATTT